MFTGTPLTRAERWKQLTVQQWVMDKQNTVHPYNGIFSVIKRNEALTQATTQMNSEKIW